MPRKGFFKSASKLEKRDVFLLENAMEKNECNIYLFSIESLFLLYLKDIVRRKIVYLHKTLRIEQVNSGWHVKGK